jgi:hypothetical protein
VGSLPHRDPVSAVRLVLELLPDLPAAPQLPRRSPAEGMLAQAARGIPGVTVAPDGGLVVDPAGLEAPSVATVAGFDVGHAGLLAFLDAVAGRSGPVKLQLTGPLTLAAALVDGGAPPAVAPLVAGNAVRAAGGGLLTFARRRLPSAPLVVWLDEPWLARWPELGLGSEEAIDLLSGALAAVEPGAVTGVHCCGPADWRLPVAAGASILSLPVDASVDEVRLDALAGHLDRGGWIAWGAVPTTGPVGDDEERLLRRLLTVWDGLRALGWARDRVASRALVTPACGLAGHGTGQAAAILRLAGRLGAQVASMAGGGSG